MLLPQLQGYLNDAGRVHLARTELLLREVAGYEDEIFQRHKKREAVTPTLTLTLTRTCCGWAAGRGLSSST